MPSPDFLRWFVPLVFFVTGALAYAFAKEARPLAVALFTVGAFWLCYTVGKLHI